MKKQKEKNEEVIVDPRKLKNYVYGQNIPKLSLQYFSHVSNKEFNLEHLILIRMMLRSGKFTEFMIKPVRNMFDFNDGTYVIDTDYLIDDISSKMKCIFYHEDFSLPLRLSFNTANMKANILSRNPDMQKFLVNINPYTLHDAVNAKVIEKAVAGAELSKQLNTIFWIVIINLILIILVGMMIGIMARY